VNYNFGERLPNLSEGDVDGDGFVGQEDIDAFCRAVRAKNPWFDLTEDRRVDEGDLWRFVANVFGSIPGDANLDGQFDSSDLLQVFVAGQYEDGDADNSVWATGDWNCDGDFSTSDLVAALQSGAYAANASVPSMVTAAAIEQRWQNAPFAAHGDERLEKDRFFDRNSALESEKSTATELRDDGHSAILSSPANGPPLATRIDALDTVVEELALALLREL
jgi:hypothetical protein